MCFTKDFEALCSINLKKKKTNKNDVRKKHYGSLHFTMLKIMNLGPIKCISVRIFFIKVCFSRLKCLILCLRETQKRRIFDVHKDCSVRSRRIYANNALTTQCDFRLANVFFNVSYTCT